MKSKFNFKSLSRVVVLSLSLLAPAKSFASDELVLGEDTGKPAIVVLLNGASEDRKELNVSSLENGVLTSFRGLKITRDRTLVVSLNGASEDREELDVRSLEDGVLTPLRGINITRRHRTLVVSGTAENTLLIDAPDFKVTPEGVMVGKKLVILAAGVFGSLPSRILSKEVLLKAPASLFFLEPPVTLDSSDED